MCLAATGISATWRRRCSLAALAVGGLDLAFRQVLVEGVVQPVKAMTVEDDLGIRDPGALGDGVDVPVDLQGKAVDDVAHTYRSGAVGCVMAGIEAIAPWSHASRIARSRDAAGDLMPLITPSLPLATQEPTPGGDQDCG